MNSMIKCVQSSDSQIPQVAILQIHPGAVIPAESLLALSKRFIFKRWFVRIFLLPSVKGVSDYPRSLPDNFIGVDLSRAVDARAFHIQHRAAAGVVQGVPVIRYAGDAAAPAACISWHPWTIFGFFVGTLYCLSLATHCLWDLLQAICDKNRLRCMLQACGSRSLSL